MKRLIAFAWLIWAIITPSHAMAGTPYSIHWAMIQENPSCEHARLTNNGGGYFDVNNTPIPTYEKPGAFETLANGWESNLAEAGFDSVLLRIGANDFAFGVENSSGDNSCVHSQNVVILAAPTLGIEKPLFAFRRDGAAFSGSAQLDLKLEEINPQLAKDIVFLEGQIAYERSSLIANADTVANLDERLDALQQLETELGDLLKRPLDELTVEDLDEMLKRYSSVIDESTREALKQVLADFKKSLVDLQKELASLMSNFGDLTRP